MLPTNGQFGCQLQIGGGAKLVVAAAQRTVSPWQRSGETIGHLRPPCERDLDASALQQASAVVVSLSPGSTVRTHAKVSSDEEQQHWRRHCSAV